MLSSFLGILLLLCFNLKQNKAMHLSTGATIRVLGTLMQRWLQNIQNGNIVKQSSETVAILLNYITLLHKFNYLQNF